jgi:ABC-type oligopeptide transport system substrate-binding subunit
VKEGDTNTDKEKRLAAYRKAISRIMEQMYMLPTNSAASTTPTQRSQFQVLQGRNSALLPLQLK